jgi:phage regulator Rha-like protein
MLRLKKCWEIKYKLAETFEEMEAVLNAARFNKETRLLVKESYKLLGL